MRLPSGAKTVAFVASLLLAGYGGWAGHAAAVTAHVTPAPAPVAAPAEVPAPETTPTLTPAEPVLEQIPVPVPAVVTGLPYMTECHTQGKRPDPGCTPGSVNPDVTQANIGQTICKPGWGVQLLPPPAVTGPVKKAAMKAYGIPAKAAPSTALDHLVPIALGGSDDATNMWPLRDEGPPAITKRKVEVTVEAAVCSGKVPLAAAQLTVAQDWTTAEQTLGLK